MAGLTPRENFWKAANHEEPERLPIFWGGSNSSIVPSHYEALCRHLGISDVKTGVGDFGVVNLHAEIKKRFHSDVELVLMGAPRRIRLENGLIQDGMWGFLMKDVGGFRTHPDQIAPLRRGVKDLIKTLGPGGGFLFATSHNLEPDTPLENIVALFDAAHEFGRYPLNLD